MMCLVEARVMLLSVPNALCGSCHYLLALHAQYDRDAQQESCVHKYNRAGMMKQVVDQDYHGYECEGTDKESIELKGNLRAAVNH
jgi:hypothetical protein